MAKRSTPKTDKKIEQTPDVTETRPEQKTTKKTAARPRKPVKPPPTRGPRKPAATRSVGDKAAAVEPARAARAAKQAEPQISASPEIQSVEPSSPLDILMVTPEARPFAKTGGLADVCGALPR